MMDYDYLAIIRRPGIVVACLSIMVLFASLGMMEVLFPLYMDSLSYSKASIGMLFLILSVFLVLGQPANRLLDGAQRTLCAHPDRIRGSCLFSLSYGVVLKLSRLGAGLYGIRRLYRRDHLCLHAPYRAEQQSRRTGRSLRHLELSLFCRLSLGPGPGGCAV